MVCDGEHSSLISKENMKMYFLFGADITSNVFEKIIKPILGCF